VLSNIGLTGLTFPTIDSWIKWPELAWYWANLPHWITSTISKSVLDKARKGCSTFQVLVGMLLQQVLSNIGLTHVIFPTIDSSIKWPELAWYWANILHWIASTIPNYILDKAWEAFSTFQVLLGMLLQHLLSNVGLTRLIFPTIDSLIILPTLSWYWANILHWIASTIPKYILDKAWKGCRTFQVLLGMLLQHLLSNIGLTRLIFPTIDSSIKWPELAWYWANILH
jgi:hypothetical protein